RECFWTWGNPEAVGIPAKDTVPVLVVTCRKGQPFGFWLAQLRAAGAGRHRHHCLARLPRCQPVDTGYLDATAACRRTGRLVPQWRGDPLRRWRRLPGSLLVLRRVRDHAPVIPLT